MQRSRQLSIIARWTWQGSYSLMLDNRLRNVSTKIYWPLVPHNLKLELQNLYINKSLHFPLADIGNVSTCIISGGEMTAGQKK